MDRMFIDNRNRLWVSTLTEDEDQFRWWVLDDEGVLLGRFVWPGQQTIPSLPATILGIRTVKNEFLYAYEREPETRQGMIVRYRIELEER